MGAIAGCPCTDCQSTGPVQLAIGKGYGHASVTSAQHHLELQENRQSGSGCMVPLARGWPVERFMPPSFGKCFPGSFESNLL